MVQLLKILVLKFDNMFDPSPTLVYKTTDSTKLSSDLWMNAMAWVPHHQINEQMQFINANYDFFSSQGTVSRILFFLPCLCNNYRLLVLFLRTWLHVSVSQLLRRLVPVLWGAQIVKDKSSDTSLLISPMDVDIWC